LTDEHEQSGEPAEAEDARRPAKTTGFALLNHHLRYPRAYAWLLLFSALDVILTWIIINYGGSEANPVADAVIDRWELDGMVVYKFVLIAVFILICEGVGALRDSTGRVLSRVSIAIACVPVTWSLFLLARYA